MASEVWLIAEFTIKEGKLDAFKDIANKFITTVQENEPGALTYQLYFDHKQAKCLAIEQYRDSKAVLTHFKNAGALGLKLLGTAQLTRRELVGNVSNELKIAAIPFGVTFFKPWGGFVREQEVSRAC